MMRVGKSKKKFISYSTFLQASWLFETIHKADKVLIGENYLNRL